MLLCVIQLVLDSPSHARESNFLHFHLPWNAKLVGNLLSVFTMVLTRTRNKPSTRSTRAARRQSRYCVYSRPLSAAPPPPAPSPICSSCESAIPLLKDYTKLHPCGHILCCMCTMKMQIERGCMPLCCPVDACQAKYTTSVQMCCDGEQVGQTIINPDVGSDTFVEQQMPLKYLTCKCLHELHEGRQILALYYARVQPKPDVCSVVASCKTFVVDPDGGDMLECNEESLKEMGQFFQLLHPLLLPSKKQQKDEVDLPVMCPREFLDFRCSELQLLDNAMYALSSGYALQLIRIICLDV